MTASGWPWEWPDGELQVSGCVLYSDGEPVVMCAPGLARALQANLAARDAAAMPVVQMEVQRREDVVAELRRQITALERRLAGYRDGWQAVKPGARTGVTIYGHEDSDIHVRGDVVVDLPYTPYAHDPERGWVILTLSCGVVLRVELYGQWKITPVHVPGDVDLVVKSDEYGDVVIIGTPVSWVALGDSYAPREDVAQAGNESQS